MKFRKIFIVLLIKVKFIFALPIDEDEIEFFYNARFGGDTSSVNQFLSDDFIYEHIPYVGLGVEVHYVDESLLIIETIEDSIPNLLQKGDRIYEHNNKIVDSLGLSTTGAVGDLQKLIVTKVGDSVFQEIKLPLKEIQKKQNLQSYLKTISNYANRWYEYDIDIIEIILTKTRAVVHYRWEGVKSPYGETYTFSSIEILHINRKTKLIERIKMFWSEKQFRDQFK